MLKVTRGFARVAILSIGIGLAILAVRLLAVGGGSGSIALTTFDVAYLQDFNTLANSGTSSSLPTGWFIDENGTSTAVNGLYTAGTGSGTAGDTYSFGASGSNERALGELRSGTLVPVIGASFTNDTGGTIASLDVAYTGEQWRLGTAGRGPDRLDFQYSVNATGLITGTWTDVDPLDFSSPDAGVGTVGLRDGNNPAFRLAIAGQIAGLTLPPGGTIWLRCLDVDVSGADDGLAVDDFSIIPHGGVVPTNPSGVGTANPATVSSGDSTTLTVAVTPGSTPTSTGLAVMANLGAIGGSATQPFIDSGANTFTFAATVALGTTPGAKSLPFTVSDAQGRTGTGTISLTVTAPAVITAIHDIQGPGSTSPFVGQSVTTEGIVTARRFNNGFFIQTPDAEADPDPNTSEGIFVFTGSAAPAIAQVGNRVRVTGAVSEFKPSTDVLSLTMTELTSPAVVQLSTGDSLPTVITLTNADTDPTGPVGQLERYEGMRVHVNTLNVVAPTQGSVNEANATGSSNGVYYGVLSSIARPFREAGLELPAALPPGSPCCVTRFDGNPEKIRVNSIGQTVFGLADATIVTTGAVVSDITGVLDYSVHAYTILPDFGAQGSVVPGLPGYMPVTPPAAHRFTIATANLERFFDTVNDPNTSDVALTIGAYAKRLSKVGLQICDVMRAPDIIGVEEVENLTALQDIAGAANARLTCGGTQYHAYLFEGNDPGGIDDGFLVNLNRVVVNDVHQEGKDTTYINPNNGMHELLNDRPPTVLHATITVPGDAEQHVTVIANHLRSLNGIDEDPGDGNRVRTKRLKQAEYLGHLIETLQFEGDPLVAVGDFNAFEFSDGYVDIIGTIKGTPVPADHVVLASTDIPNVPSPLTDLIESDTTTRRYSYSFDGNAQSLDHLLATQVAVQIFDHVEWGHSNADFPEAFRGDETRPERLSDHDPVVGYFVLAAQTTTTVTATPDPAHLAQDITFTANVAGILQVTSGFVQFSDGAGYSASIAVVNGQASVTVPASSFGVGSHTMSASYSDGPTFARSSGSAPFDVIDNDAFSGFFAPVDNLPVLNQVKAGQAIPVKFSLGGNLGLNIFAAGYPRSETVPCDAPVPVSGIDETVTAGNSSVSFDPVSRQYIYVWKTDKAWVGSCRQFVMKLTDGTIHRANYQFTK